MGSEDVYGEARETKDEAELDRINGKPTFTRPLVKKREIPTFQAWAHTCQQGRYGERKANNTFSLNETLRLVHIEGSLLGKARIDRITRELVQSAIDTKIKETYTKGKSDKPHNYSAAYIRRYHAFISKLLSLAVEAGYIQTNPAAKIELPEVQDRINRILAPEEARNLLNPKNRIDAMILVSVHTGMGRGELHRLQWGDIHENMIIVPGTKNKYRRRPVPLTPECRLAIESQPKRSVFVFSTESGKQMNLRNINRDFSARKAELGIPAETRLQDMRGTYLSLLIEAGADLKTTQTLAGHSDPRTTIKSYLRSRQATQEAAVETMRLMISGEKPKGKKKIGAVK